MSCQLECTQIAYVQSRANLSTGASDSIQQAALAVIVRMPPAARLARAAAMNQAADPLALAGLRHRHPTATPHAIGVALALQRIGRSHDRILAARSTKETTVPDTPADFWPSPSVWPPCVPISASPT